MIKYRIVCLFLLVNYNYKQNTACHYQQELSHSHSFNQYKSFLYCFKDQIKLHINSFQKHKLRWYLIKKEHV